MQQIPSGLQGNKGGSPWTRVCVMTRFTHTANHQTPPAAAWPHVHNDKVCSNIGELRLHGSRENRRLHDVIFSCWSICRYHSDAKRHAKWGLTFKALFVHDDGVVLWGLSQTEEFASKKMVKRKLNNGSRLFLVLNLLHDVYDIS